MPFLSVAAVVSTEAKMRIVKRILSVMLLLCLISGFAGAEAPEDPDSVTVLDYGDKWHPFPSIVAEIEKHPNLERVIMYGTPVGIVNIGKLTKRFPNITFEWTIRFKEHSVRTDTTAFALRHTRFSLHHLNIQIALFRFCTKLKALDVSYNYCNELSFTSGMKDLRVLVITNNHVSDLTPLADRNHLEYLDVTSNDIRDVTPLTGLTHLMDLNLSDNDIEDLTPLAKMTWLKRLWLCKVPGATAEAVQMLKEALPDTEICTTDQSAWASHPHYTHIHTMFNRNKGYVPFDDSWPEE